MARIHDEQNLQLRKRARRRVVGAIVLVVITVIALPMLLEPIPKQKGKEIKIIFPSESLQNRHSLAAVQENKAQNLVNPRSANIRSGKDEIAEIELIEDNKSSPVVKKFIVQLGAFSDSIKAKNQQQSLMLSGVEKAYTETINNNGTEITRVRIGPFSNYEAAEREQKKLKKIGVIGVVISM
tara:strand:+ start:791 stop:1336 length:546 start_codon:yes stop_codon:yes gene_type:complete